MKVCGKYFAVVLLMSLFAVSVNAQIMNPIKAGKVLINTKKLVSLARKATNNNDMDQGQAIKYWTDKAIEKKVSLPQDGSIDSGVEIIERLVEFAKKEMEGQEAQTTSSKEDNVKQPTTQSAYSKGVKVVLNGTLKESATITYGDGHTEIIESMPHIFYVPKTMLPHTITISSPNYDYTDITIHKKEQGGVGHTYVLKSTKKMMATAPMQIVQQQIVAPTETDKPTIDWSHGVNAAPKSGAKNENTFALIIANEEYEMVSPVSMANFDGEVFKSYCEKTLGLTENQIKYYPNASYGKMSRAFREIKDIADAFNGNINLIIYYAGHGIPDNATKDAYIMPIDADGTDVGVCYSLQKMYKDIEDLHINQCVVFMDACFSGAKRGGDMIIAARGVAIKAKEAKPKSATVVFSATSDEQAAYPYEEEKHGLFTYFLLKKLQETNGKATLGDLADYLSSQVAQNSIVINGKKQTPTITVSDDIQTSWKKLKLIN